MSYKIAIRRNDTGEVRVVDMKVEWGDNSFFWLTEGNYGCDCNRELEFYRGRDGARPYHEDESLCLGYGAYSILYAELPGGERVPIDDDIDIDAIYGDRDHMRVYPHHDHCPPVYYSDDDLQLGEDTQERRAWKHFCGIDENSRMYWREHGAVERPS